MGTTNYSSSYKSQAVIPCVPKFTNILVVKGLQSLKEFYFIDGLSDVQELRWVDA